MRRCDVAAGGAPHELARPVEVSIRGGMVVSVVMTENERMFRRLIEEGIGGGDPTVIDEIVAPDFTEHQHGLTSGSEGLKTIARRLHTWFPDLSLTVEDVVVDGDKVWGRIVGRGTNTGSIMGRAPSGKHIEIDIIDICRFEGGKMVEHWGVPDQLSMLEQVGIFPGAPTPQP